MSRTTKIAGLICVFGGLTGCGAEGPPTPTLEEFRASLETVDGAYVVEGDILLHGDGELQAYYDTYVNPSEVAAVSDPLTINRWNGADDGYNSDTQNNLTYCVSNSFNTTANPTRKTTVVNNLATAASNWETLLNVNFTHVSAEDGSCTSTNSNVWFDVRPSSSVASNIAMAFFPHESRSTRQVLVGSSAGGSNLFTHEFGHILGFRHEQGRSEYVLPAGKLPPTGATSCSESGFRVITSYDAASVMHYPNSQNVCPGTANNYSITSTDTLGAQRIFGARVGTCKLASKDTCGAQGATCENRQGDNGNRYDMCRWSAANTEARCNATEGIWTTATSGFALHNPGSVPVGAAGACITQTNNLACSGTDENTCLRSGATCERQWNTSGQRKDLCRWHRVRSEAACNLTNGIWTTSTSGFASVWPKSVPAGWSGACITQVANL